MVKMTETTPGRNGRKPAGGAIALSEKDTPKDYSKPLALAPEKPTTEEEDLEEIGTTVLRLSQGKLTLEEPSYKTLRDCRIKCARWAHDNPEIAQADPGIAELEYVLYLCIDSAIEWAPHNGPTQADLNYKQFEEFSASDFRKITRLMKKYAGNSDS